MLAATAADLLPLSDISREILMATGLYTSMGEVIIFRARSDGFVQIAGPGIVADMGRLKDMLRQLGAELTDRVILGIVAFNLNVTAIIVINFRQGLIDKTDTVANFVT